MVRLTTLGIRQVPADTVEASQMFGANSRQTLLKVELPQAVPSIMAGINQTINMALGIVVIAWASLFVVEATVSVEYVGAVPKGIVSGVVALPDGAT